MSTPSSAGPDPRIQAQPAPPGPPEHRAQPFPPGTAHYQAQPYQGPRYPASQYQQQYAVAYPGGMSPSGYPAPPQGPVYQAKFRKHTGLLIMAQWQDSYVTGGYEDVRRAYRAAQTHCLLAGWWGLISLLVYNWIALIGNASEMKRITDQARRYGDRV